MRILVTGATGFLGSYITRLLLKSNHSVVAIHRAQSSFQLLEEVKDQIEWVEANLLEPASLEFAFNNLDLVVHAAASISIGSTDLDLLNRINIEGTANIVNLSLSNNVKKLIYVSSVAALDRAKEELIIDESFDFKESQYSTHYGKSKHLGELEAWRGMAEGLQVSVICPSLILGAGDWTQSSLQLYKQIRTNNKMYPSGGMGVVDVRDVAQSIVQILKDFPNGRKFIISGHNTSFKELYYMLSKAWDMPQPKRELKGVLKPLAFAYLYLSSLLGLRRGRFSKKTFNNLFRIYRYNNQRSTDELGLEYRSLKTTIDESCQAYSRSILEKKTYAICQF